MVRNIPPLGNVISSSNTARPFIMAEQQKNEKWKKMVRKYGWNGNFLFHLRGRHGDEVLCSDDVSLRQLKETTHFLPIRPALRHCYGINIFWKRMAICDGNGRRSRTKSFLIALLWTHPHHTTRSPPHTGNCGDSQKRQKTHRMGKNMQANWTLSIFIYFGSINTSIHIHIHTVSLFGVLVGVARRPSTVDEWAELSASPIFNFYSSFCHSTRKQKYKFICFGSKNGVVFVIPLLIILQNVSGIWSGWVILGPGPCKMCVLVLYAVWCQCCVVMPDAACTRQPTIFL